MPQFDSTYNQSKKEIRRNIIKKDHMCKLTKFDVDKLTNKIINGYEMKNQIKVIQHNKT